MEIVLGSNGRLALTVSLIGHILGVNNDGDTVALGPSNNRTALRARTNFLLGNQYGITRSVTVRRLMPMLKQANQNQLAGASFVRVVTAHTLLAYVTCLGPKKTQPAISDEALQVVFNPSRINKFNHAKYVYDGIKAAVNKVKCAMPSNPTSIELESCLIVLQVIHFHWPPRTQHHTLI